MNKRNIKLIMLALGFTFTTASMAEGLSNEEYKAGKDRLAADYTAARAGCEPRSGNAKDLCVAEVRGKAKVARAELDASYKPTRKARYYVAVAKAEADYGVARERCDDLAGNGKDVCVQEAKAAETSAKAEAKSLLKIADANDTANQKSAEAFRKAGSQAADARDDATAEKLDAQYGVAKERCGIYAGGAKEHCLDRVKVDFGKS